MRSTPSPRPGWTCSCSETTSSAATASIRAPRELRLAGLAVYVVHAPELQERRARLDAALAANGLEARWVEDPDGSSLDPVLRRRYYRGRRLHWWRRARATESI